MPDEKYGESVTAAVVLSSLMPQQESSSSSSSSLGTSSSSSAHTISSSVLSLSPSAAAAGGGGKDAIEQELLQHCKSHLSKYKCPKKIIIVPTLPKNQSGKVMKAALRSSL